MAKQDGNLDIYSLNLITNDLSRKTFDEAVDYLPIFDYDENIVNQIWILSDKRNII